MATLVAKFVASAGVVATSGLVDTWQDQTGNGNHLTQTGTARLAAETDWLGRPVVQKPVDGGTRSMVIPNSLVMGSTRDLSVFMVCSAAAIPAAGAVSHDMVTLTGFGGGGIIRARIDTGVGARLSGLAKNASLPWISNVDVRGVVSNSTGVTLYTASGSETISGAASAFTHTGGGALASGVWCGDFYEIRFYVGALTGPEAAAVVADMVATYSIPTSYTKQLVCIGDSITYGTKTTQNRTYPQRLFETLGDNRGADLGISGNTISSLTTRATQNDWYVTTAPLTKNVLIVHIGTNDGGSSGGFQSAATVYANLVTYLQARVAAGWASGQNKVYACTIIDSANSVFTASYNALIRGAANGGSGNGIVADAGVSGLIDLYASPYFDPGSNGDTTYYASDNTHPTSAGTVKFADVVLQTIAASSGSMFFAC